MARRKKGRPTKLTPELQERLCEAVAAGSYYRDACQYAGISYKNFRAWMNRGQRARSGRFRDFRNAVHKAMSDAKLEVIKEWRLCIPGNYRAARDFLARRFPKQWGAKTKIEQEHSGKDGGPVILQVLGGQTKAEDLQ